MFTFFFGTGVKCDRIHARQVSCLFPLSVPHYVAQAGLGLTLEPRLVLGSLVMALPAEQSKWQVGATRPCKAELLSHTF